MAVASRPTLLGVALAVAWMSSAAVDALSSSEKAGISQKSMECMPCSMTYVGDAYLDIFNGKLDQQRDLAEMHYSGDMCNRLAENIDAPVLSELHRQLVGEGSHRRLVYTMNFNACQGAMVSFLDSYDAHLVIIEKLPHGVFADPFELQHFVERKVFLDVAVFGDSNLELPSALSNRSAVEVHVDLRPSTSANCNLIIGLPLHARYPPLDASGYATAKFGNPDLLLRYRKKNIHSDSCMWAVKDLDVAPVEKAAWHIPCGDEAHVGLPLDASGYATVKFNNPGLLLGYRNKNTHSHSCMWALKNLDASPVEKAAWRIPCGDEAHIGLVSGITFLSALVCSVSIVLASLIF